LIRPRGLALVALLALGGCARSATPPAATFEPDSIPDAYAVPSGALMTPGSTRAWLVTPAGDFYNGAWLVRVRAIAGRDTALPPRRIAAEERWVPVLHWTRRAGDVRWDFAAVARNRGAPRDSELIVSLEVRARNLGAAPAEARLELALEPRLDGASFVAWDATHEPPRWNGGAGSEPVHAWAEGARGGETFTAGGTLAPGAERVTRLLIPAYPTRASELEGMSRRGHFGYESDTRTEWQKEIARGARFALGDSDVDLALRAATVVLLSCRERRGTRWVPIGGPFQYRDVWLRDGARAIAALSVAGYTREARELADGFLLLQWPHGAFLSQRGQLDGTGQALWAFEQALLRPQPPPATELNRFADAAALAAHWFSRQRDLGQKIGGTFPTMLPFADPRDGELTRAQLVGNDAWAIAGVRASVRLLEAAGRAGAVDPMRAQLARGLSDFHAALEASGSPDLPPSWQRVGRDWGNFAAAWPCGAIAPSDPRAAAFAARVWRAGGGAGLTFYGTPDSLHGYLGADLGVWAMRVGLRAQADSVLDAHLRWRTASGTAGEIFDRHGAYGGNLPPHPTAAAALWMLVRNAVIYDDEDTLRLTMGARDAWWRGARVERAPTRWGLIDLAFSRAGSEASWAWTAVPVWTALALPAGTRLASAAPAPLVGAAGAREVLAPPGTRLAKVTVAEDAGR
jgi:hypothetical protein